jgi:hypothetical protein
MTVTVGPAHLSWQKEGLWLEAAGVDIPALMVENLKR